MDIYIYIIYIYIYIYILIKAYIHIYPKTVSAVRVLAVFLLYQVFDVTAFDAHAVTKSCAQARLTVMVTLRPCARKSLLPSLLCAGACDMTRSMTRSDSKMSLAS